MNHPTPTSTTSSIRAIRWLLSVAVLACFPMPGHAVNVSPSTVLWPGGTVYYAFNANVDAAKRQRFRDAAGEWATFGALTFVERTTEPDYIMVNDDPGISHGNSMLGMVGGAQPLNIGSTVWNRPTLLHEIGHSLGLNHEHQRSDRDTYVVLVESNIAGGASNGNFVRISDSINLGPYDFYSIMHYARDHAGITPGEDTLLTQPAYAPFLDVMGRTYLDRCLSRVDREGIAALYGPGPALGLVVTNTKDSGPGSLRTALYRALDIATDSVVATPVVTFQIPAGDPGFAAGVFTIRPTARLIGVGPRTTIDGTSQAAFGGDTNTSGPEIVLNGAEILTPTDFGVGLWLPEQDCIVRGLGVGAFSMQGIVITGHDNVVEGCYVGIDATGTVATPNGFAGVHIGLGGTGNRIGGTTVAARNVISGNANQGIAIIDAATSGNVVQGNYIGTNADGTAAVPNVFTGVLLYYGTDNNTVGGTVAGAGNVISGNNMQGIWIGDAGTTGNVVAGNRIGVNAAGTAAISNTFAGVMINGTAQGNTIGGNVAGAGNVISGNASQGVYLRDVGTSGNVVQGNFIGLNAAGAASVANAFAGVEVSGGAENNTIGGTTVEARNVISGNTSQGIFIGGATTGSNVVKGNYIGINAAGTAALANGFCGVQLNNGTHDNIVGGFAPGEGNIISGNTLQGIALSGGVNNRIAGNFIGTNAVGTAAIANLQSGVELYAAATGNVVGGSEPGAGNVISGNSLRGVSISAAGTSNNVIAGNYIGLNAAGTAALGNIGRGVDIFSSASGNIVGGFTPGARNTISGNTTQGVSISGSASNNRIAGNYIGTNLAGSASIANLQQGMEIFGGANGNIVGGSESGAGNVISGNSSRAIGISGAATSNNTIAGNYIGVNAAGTAALANGGAGVNFFSSASGNTLGGFTSAARNVISGNTGQGVVMSGSANNNRIAGNYIGTNAAGTAAVANGGIGVNLFGAANNNKIGGTEFGAGNLISGNAQRGILFSDAGTTANIVAGNLIGLNAAGTAAIPNVASGVGIFSGATNNVIGVPNGGRNFICGNTAQGISISGNGTNGNMVQGNFIGVTPAGAALGNTGPSGMGVQISAGASSTLIGGSTPGASNTIVGNAQGAVEIYDAASQRNTVSGNLFLANGLLGLDLQGGTQTARVTANDAGDGDTGPNNLQNYPVLTSAVLGLGTTIDGTLNSTASTTFRIEFYATFLPDGTGFGEGQFFIGAINTTTDAGGNAAFSATLTACVPPGRAISATATDPLGNTSEFAQNRTVTTIDTDTDGLPDVYETANGLNPAVADATTDTDSDGQSNLAEFRAGTDPNNPQSLIQMTVAGYTAAGAQLSLQTLAGRTYRLEYSDAMATPTAWRLFSDQIFGTGSPIPITDTNAGTLQKRFYRMTVLPL